MNDSVVRLALAALVAAFSLWIPTGAMAQAGASAELTDSLSCIVGAGSATPVGSTNSSVTADIGASGVGCAADAGGYSHHGVVGAFADASLAFENSSSGSLRGESSASWNDSLDVIWPAGVAVAGVSTLRVGFSLDAHGGVSATRSDAEGFNLAIGVAGIDYSFNFAGSAFSGSQSLSAGEPLVINGSFGSLTGSVDLTPNGAVNGAYTFSSIGLSMAGHAGALVQNKFIGLGLHTGSALADFGSTLQWQGITDVQAFDGTGAELVLPADFRLGLIGGQNGFDYWNAAPLTVPEPGTWASMLCGLVALVGVGRRDARACRKFYCTPSRAGTWAWTTKALVETRPLALGPTRHSI
jgi:hypothetical protein